MTGTLLSVPKSVSLTPPLRAQAPQEGLAPLKRALCTVSSAPRTEVPVGADTAGSPRRHPTDSQNISVKQFTDHGADLRATSDARTVRSYNPIVRCAYHYHDYHHDYHYHQHFNQISWMMAHKRSASTTCSCQCQCGVGRRAKHNPIRKKLACTGWIRQRQLYSSFQRSDGRSTHGISEKTARTAVDLLYCRESAEETQGPSCCFFRSIDDVTSRHLFPRLLKYRVVALDLSPSRWQECTPSDIETNVDCNSLWANGVWKADAVGTAAQPSSHTGKRQKLTSARSGSTSVFELPNATCRSRPCDEDDHLVAVCVAARTHEAMHVCQRHLSQRSLDFTILDLLGNIHQCTFLFI
jgi:hypothetical protein